MKTTGSLVALLLFALSFFSCQEPSSRSNPAYSNAFKGIWQLYYMPGYSMPYEVMYAEKQPYLELDPEKGTYRGFVMCNSISGSLEILDSVQIHFSDPVKTTEECKGPAEASFLDALKKAEYYQWHHPDTVWLIRQNLLVMKLARKRD